MSSGILAEVGTRVESVEHALKVLTVVYAVETANGARTGRGVAGRARERREGARRKKARWRSGGEPRRRLVQ